MSTVFTPLLNQFSWVDATTGAGGAALPAGEAPASTTIGIRPDGNAAFSLGNYQWMVIVQAPGTTETVSALNAALKTQLPPGNYWANALQTDTYNGANFQSAWGASEVPFSIPLPGVAPGAPTNLAVS